MRLKEARSAAKMTQQVMADKLGIERSSYARYETGARQPDLTMLEKMADVLCVSVDYLLGRTDDPFFEYRSAPDGDVILVTEKTPDGEIPPEAEYDEDDYVEFDLDTMPTNPEQLVLFIKTALAEKKAQIAQKQAAKADQQTK